MLLGKKNSPHKPICNPVAMPFSLSRLIHFAIAGYIPIHPLSIPMYVDSPQCSWLSFCDQGASLRPTRISQVDLYVKYNI